MLETTAQRKINRTGALRHYTATAVEQKITLQKWWQDVLLVEIYFVDSSLLGCDTVSVGEWLPVFYFLRLHLTFEDEHTKTSKLILPMTRCTIPQSSAPWIRIPNLRKNFHKLWYCNDQMQLSVTCIFFCQSCCIIPYDAIVSSLSMNFYTFSILYNCE